MLFLPFFLSLTSVEGMWKGIFWVATTGSVTIYYETSLSEEIYHLVDTKLHKSLLPREVVILYENAVLNTKYTPNVHSMLTGYTATVFQINKISLNQIPYNKSA